MKNTYALLILLSLIICSCSTKEQGSIEGMWSVEKVSMGDESMTPQGRWVRFNADSTQVSGNGWLQHSEGSWSLVQSKLSIINANGVKDTEEPFTVTYSNNTMQWKRNEGGALVTVDLKRVDKIPKTAGNTVLGLWKLDSATEEGKDISDTLNPENKATIFFRWDQVYVAQHMPENRRSGIYRFHGHQPEIQMVNYGDSPQFTFWKFKVIDNTLEMISTDQKSVLKFKRIDQFIR